jgi:eukaryotic-like serine/threonine-protein kinase
MNGSNPGRAAPRRRTTSAMQTGDARRQDRLHAVLEEVLQLPPERRDAFLAAVGQEEPLLRAELDRLLRAATPPDDFLERPAWGPREAIVTAPTRTPMFEPGTELAGRFRIVRLIGMGGMGEVYEAFDQELRSAVALKTIRAGKSDDPAAIARFRREVLRARRVAHPHVCRVYDLFSHPSASGPSVPFLTMELLDGETLAEHLERHGPLQRPELDRIATQVASALDEAHRQQIVHRDLKPANIVLVSGAEQARAVVTDFGLALQVEERGDSSPNLSEVHGGTEDYMAPEQRASSDVTAAADVYAFGVLLHEMWTGVTPGRAGTAQLPPAWQRAVERCLERDPAKRPATASEALAEALGSPTRQGTTVRVAMALGLVLVTVSLLFWFLRLFQMSPETAAPTMVLVPVANESGDGTFDGLTDVLRYQLTQSMFLNVLEPDQVNQVLREMVHAAGAPVTPAVAREIAWRRGAGSILYGRLVKATSGYSFVLRVERRGGRPDSEGRTWSRTFEAKDGAELQRLVREAGRWVRGAAGEALADIPNADRPVEEVTSNSWAAVSLFSRAETLAADGRRDDALALLAEAVRIDPEFALAHMRMGDILMGKRRQDEAIHHWDEALRVFDRRQLTPREAYRIRGLYAHDTADYAEAERIYRLWLLTYPNDSRPFFYIARPLVMLGRTDEAVQMLETAQRLDAFSHYIPAHLAMTHLRAGRPRDAAAHIARLRTLGEDGWADALAGQSAFLAGDYASALAWFERLEGASNASLRSRAYSLQASVLAETGRARDALARLERGLASDRSQGLQVQQADKLIAAASLELTAGRRQVARDLCIQAEQLDQSLERLSALGRLLAHAGYPAEAERLLARFDASQAARRVQLHQQRLQGEILLARGNAAGALQHFQRAAALDAPGMPLEYLARGALAAGEHGLALATYRRMAGDPGFVWHYPDLELPGAWVDALKTYVRLAARVDAAEDTQSFQRHIGALSLAFPSTTSTSP